MGVVLVIKDAFFSKVYCCLILNYPTPIEIWIWKLVVRALLSTVDCTTSVSRDSPKHDVIVDVLENSRIE